MNDDEEEKKKKTEEVLRSKRGGLRAPPRYARVAYAILRSFAMLRSCAMNAAELGHTAILP